MERLGRKMRFARLMHRLSAFLADLRSAPPAAAIPSLPWPPPRVLGHGWACVPSGPIRTGRRCDTQETDAQERRTSMVSTVRTNLRLVVVGAVVLTAHRRGR